MKPPSRATRRWLLLLAVGVAGAYLAGLVTPPALHLQQGIFAPPPVEATGVVTWDRTATDAGYVSVGVWADETVQLVAKAGTVVHTWTLGAPLQGMATVDSDGSLLAMTRPPDSLAALGLPPEAAPAVLSRQAWGGQLKWSLGDEYLSHDFTELPDGTVTALKLDPLPADFAARVPGGTRGTEADGVMWSNQIVEIDPATKAERTVFDFAKAWRPEDHPLPAFMPRSEWTHANSIYYTASDPLTHREAYLVSLRSLSTVLLIARATGQVIWSYGGTWELDQQHDATLLPNGDVLLFDDGQYRLDAVSASRLLEIDPRTDKVVWTYSGYGIVGTGFYSAITGGAQRLPNGDTLATLGTKGELMEVTPSGGVAWDYRVRWGPPDPAYPGKSLSFLFKSREYPAAEVQRLLSGE
jgi:hypothetical protein